MLVLDGCWSAGALRKKYAAGAASPHPLVCFNYILRFQIAVTRAENSENLAKVLARSAMLENEMQQINARVMAERIQVNQERIASVISLKTLRFEHM